MRLSEENYRIRSAWYTMHGHCYNPLNPKWNVYGGRGVKVCEEWHDLHAFRTWAHRYGYRVGLSLRRLDVRGDYKPENCCWMTRSEASKNRGPQKNADPWRPIARANGICEDTYAGRIRRGWPREAAATQPPTGKHNLGRKTATAPTSPQERVRWRSVAEENGINYEAFRSRLRGGWLPEEAATLPLGMRTDTVKSRRGR